MVGNQRRNPVPHLLYGLKDRLKHTVTLRPIPPSGDVLDESDHVYLYEVVGLPPGELALIAETGDNGRWQVSHTKNSVLGDWMGNYRTAEDALAVHQKQLGM